MTKNTDKTAIARIEPDGDLALRAAVELWTEATTAATTQRRAELMHDKRAAVESFFAFARKRPGDVKPADVRRWQQELEGRGLKPATIYARTSRLSSFYEWAMSAPQLSEVIGSNPVRLARPKAPRAYQTESVQALNDDELRTLVATVRGKAQAGSLIAKRDYALLLFYLLTGMRRSEVINLRGRSIEERDGVLIIKSLVKGSDYVTRELTDPAAREALIDYLEAAGRSSALRTDAPLWTRHDRAGKPGAALTSHAFAANLKGYGREAGIESIHIHQMRHTFARIVADETGSLTETQDALGHRNQGTTKVYVQRIGVKKDKHSARVSKRLGL